MSTFVLFYLVTYGYCKSHECKDPKPEYLYEYVQTTDPAMNQDKIKFSGCEIIGDQIAENDELDLSRFDPAGLPPMLVLKKSNMKRIPSNFLSKNPTSRKWDFLYIYKNKNLEPPTPATFKNAENFTKILMRDNRFTKLGANVFKEAKNLEFLALNHNQIEQLDRNTFAGLSKLKGMYLPDNKLKFFPSDVFSCLTTLEYLDLSNNQLEYLEFDLTRSPNLLKVSFKNNPVQKTKPKMFEKNSRIVYVSFEYANCFNNVFKDHSSVMSGLGNCESGFEISRYEMDVNHKKVIALQEQVAGTTKQLYILYGLCGGLLVLVICACIFAKLVQKKDDWK